MSGGNSRKQALDLEWWAEEVGLYSEGGGSHRRFGAEEGTDLTQA